MPKPDLRKTLLSQRGSLVADRKQAMDALIGAQLLAWWDTHRPQLLGIYWPMRGEPDLHDAYATLHAHGVQLALPVVVSDHAPLKFVRWLPDSIMEKDRFGAMIPSGQHAEVFPQALVIPCVGFTSSFFRLGYGGGFYDRTVARVPRPQTVGVAYTCSKVEFTADMYDIPLDDLITEEGLLPR